MQTNKSAHIRPAKALLKIKTYYYYYYYLYTTSHQ